MKIPVNLKPLRWQGFKAWRCWTFHEAGVSMGVYNQPGVGYTDMVHCGKCIAFYFFTRKGE